MPPGTTPTHDILHDGFAAVAEQSDDHDPSDPLTVHGVAIGEGDVSTGLSGVPTRWPGDVLAEMEGMLVGKPITLPESDDPEQHVGVERDPATGDLKVRASIPLDAKVGEVVDDRYEPGTGLVFEAEVNHPDAESFIERGIAQVSPVMARDVEPDPDADDDDQVVATDVHAVRDLGMVSTGAIPSNSIQPGSLTAMTADALAGLFPADGAAPDDDGAGDSVIRGGQTVLAEVADDGTLRVVETDPDDAIGRIDAFAVSRPEFQGFSSAEWSAPSLEDTYGGDIERARNAATWVRGDGETMDDLSLFIVDGDGQVNTNALDSAWRLASQTDGVGEDAAERLRALYTTLAEDARDAGEIDDDEWGDTWAPRTNGGGGDDANSGGPLPTDAPGLTGAMARRVARTRSSDRRTVKDGARSVDAHSGLARRVLGDCHGDTVDADDPVARHALGVDDDEEPEPDPVDVDDDPVARAVLGLDSGAGDGETEPDPVDPESDAVARHALGVDDGDGDGPEPDPVDVESDGVARRVLDVDPDDLETGDDGGDGGDDGGE